MAVTRLVRKAKRNKSVAKKRNQSIKRLTTVPVIKNVEVEDLKKSFAPAAKPKKEAKKKEKAEEPVAEAPKEESAE